MAATMIKLFLTATILFFFGLDGAWGGNDGGAGLKRCEYWSKVRKGDERDSNAEYRMISWILGYLSGLASAGYGDVVKATTNEALFHAVDQRCELKPQEDIVDAVDAIAKQLK